MGSTTTAPPTTHRWPQYIRKSYDIATGLVGMLMGPDRQREMPAPKLKVYLAARFSRFDELNSYRAQLEADGIEVTSRWLLGGHEWSGVPDDEIPVEDLAGFAREDLEDIDKALAIVCFTESPRSGPARGGRHVEMGYALATNTPILCVGHRENVFYCLPQVDYVETWEEAREWLRACRP